MRKWLGIFIFALLLIPSQSVWALTYDCKLNFTALDKASSPNITGIENSTCSFNENYTINLDATRFKTIGGQKYGQYSLQEFIDTTKAFSSLAPPCAKYTDDFKKGECFQWDPPGFETEENKKPLIPFWDKSWIFEDENKVDFSKNYGGKAVGSTYDISCVDLFKIALSCQKIADAPKQEPTKPEKPVDTSAAEAAAISSQKAGLEAETGTIFNKLGTTDVKVYLARFISGAMGIMGSITLVMFVYGGFLWMTSAGDSGKNETARDIVVWSSLGIAVIFASYAILDFVFGAFK